MAAFDPSSPWVLFAKLGPAASVLAAAAGVLWIASGTVSNMMSQLQRVEDNQAAMQQTLANIDITIFRFGTQIASNTKGLSDLQLLLSPDARYRLPLLPNPPVQNNQVPGITQSNPGNNR